MEASNDWELRAPAPCARLCFRARSAVEGESEEARTERLNDLNESIMQGVNATGRAFLSHTKLNDKLTLRLSVGNIRTTEKHLQQVWELLNDQLKKLTD